MSDVDAAVTRYAEITDWLYDNGAGPILQGIGAFFGNVGELGTAVIGAAAWAWNGFGNITAAAQTFFGQVSTAVGGFTQGIIDNLADFFGDIISDDDTAENPERPAFLNDDFMLDGASADDAGPWDFQPVEASGPVWLSESAAFQLDPIGDLLAVQIDPLMRAIDADWMHA